MNAKQRRLVRRAIARYEAADLRDTYAWDEPWANPRVPARVLALLNRTRRRSRYYRAVGTSNGKRDPRAFGLRCLFPGCRRRAHGVNGDLPAECKLHSTEVPF